MHWNKNPICGLIVELAVRDSNLLLLTNEIMFTSIMSRFLESNLVRIPNYDLRDLEISNLATYFASRWYNKDQNRLVRRLRKYGKPVILTLDNSFKAIIRQIFGSMYFRFFLQRYYRLAFVPGNSSKKLMRLFGFPKDKMITGFYGAHSEIFNVKKCISLRRNEFLFVGQIIDRKSILELISAYKDYRLSGGTWSLRIIGSGNLENKLVQFPGLYYEGQKSPLEIVDFMNGAKCLVLPSKGDHWGTVVCDAAACGMIILISKYVGSHHDLLNGNGFLLNSVKKNEITHYLFETSRLIELDLIAMSQRSTVVASGYNEYTFNIAIKELLNKV
jgi:glycosyltransferase involved in cell wall biosynthesis